MDLKALEQSLVLGAAGMTAIFVFMAGLIAIIHFYIKAATRFFPDRKEELRAESRATEPEGHEDTGMSEVAAAVAAAVRGNGA